MGEREYYGIDAPGVVRSLGLVGAALVLAGLLAAKHHPILRNSLLVPGLCMMGTACWMLASSLWLKRIVVRSLLNERQWIGNEAILDVGSGRGLVAIEAARRSPRGAIRAIDLWQKADLSGNNPDALRANARAAAVERQLMIDTGDARNMPYADATFDVVTSMTAIHNIPDATGRQAAISEIWRVTKPGGQILIFDIHHARSYLGHLRELGASDTKLSGPILLWGLIGWRFSAHKPLVIAERA